MKRYRTLLLILGLCLAFQFLFAQQYKYPTPKKVDVVDNFHGTNVSDPYRWMEDTESKELKDWIEAENNITFDYLNAIPGREKIKTRLTELWNYPRFSVPFKQGNHYFFSKNDGLQNQSVMYMQDQLDGTPTVVIDPNTLSTDGTVALSTQSYSHDGSLLAYGLSKSGSDWQEVHIRDLNTSKDFSEVIQWCRFSSIAWRHDNKGFYYNRFPEPGSVPKGEENFNNKVYWHDLGTSQSNDRLVYEEPEAKDLSFSPMITDDGEYLILIVGRGTDTETRIYYRKEIDGGKFIKLLDKADASYSFIDNDGPVFYFDTNLDAPKERVIAIDTRNPDPSNWKEIIPQHDEVISQALTANNQFVVSYLKDAHHLLKIFTMDGGFLRELELPSIGAISGLSGKRGEHELFFGFTSFVYPTTIFRYDFSTSTLATFRKSQAKFDPSQYETKQVFCRSSDGTKIPVFLTYKQGIQLNGNNPVLLYGYGGFNINMLPSFLPWRLVWLENGGIYASANLRGGSEYGEDWHKAGMLDKKQNVFDDFIAASQWLIDNKYTSSSKLAIMGGSNGGLLVSACMLQQPQLFGAVICQVPVTDMLRYHKFTIGHFWIGEYGDAETNPDQFKFMYAYSPLHNIKKGVAYPSIMITTADHDDRVVPAHAMKFTATLQEADAGKNPVLIRIDTKAGHGGGKPISKQIEELTDTFAFLFKTLGLTPLN